MSKPIVVVPGSIYQHVIDRVQASFEMIRIESADASLLTNEQRESISAIASSVPLSNEFISSLPSLKIIAHFGVGYDVIDASFAGKNGVMVTNTPDVLSAEVADTTIGLLLNTIRELPRAENYLRQGKWVSDGAYPLTPLSLGKRSVGIYGLGRIGLEITTRLEGFGVDIHYHSRNQKEGIGYKYHSTLLQMANAVDTLISIVPGNEATERTINADILKALGSNGVFINVGRGSVVDDNALIDALENGVIAAAGLDVFTDEPNVPARLMELDNVSLLPHVASASVLTRNAMADLQVDNLVEWFSGKAPISPVVETAHIENK